MSILVLCIGIFLIAFNHDVMKNHKAWEQRQREATLRKIINNRTYAPTNPHTSPEAETGLENYSGEFNREFEDTQ